METFFIIVRDPNEKILTELMFLMFIDVNTKAICAMSADPTWLTFGKGKGLRQPIEMF